MTPQATPLPPCLIFPLSLRLSTPASPPPGGPSGRRSRSRSTPARRARHRRGSSATAATVGRAGSYRPRRSARRFDDGPCRRQRPALEQWREHVAREPRARSADVIAEVVGTRPAGVIGELAELGVLRAVRARRHLETR